MAWFGQRPWKTARPRRHGEASLGHGETSSSIALTATGMEPRQPFVKPRPHAANAGSGRRCTARRFAHRDANRHAPADRARHRVRLHRARRLGHLLHAFLAHHPARDIGHHLLMLLCHVTAAAAAHRLATLLRNQLARGVRDALHLLLGNHRAAAARDHAAVLLGDCPAGGVGDVLDFLLGDHGAAAAGDHAAVLLADQLAGGVGDALYLLLRHHRAAPAGDHLAVLFRHQLAGRVWHLLHDRVRDGLAHGVRDDLAMFLLHVVTGAGGTNFLVRHPRPLAGPTAGALHLVVTGLAGAVVRPAGARIKLPATPLPAAAGHDRAGAIFSLDLPFAGADLVAVLAVHRLAGVVFADALLLLGDRAIAGHRDLLAVLLIDGTAG